MTSNKTSQRRRGGGGRQEAALAALISQPTHKAAAEACGVSKATIQRWLAEPEFSARYQALKAEVVGSMTNQLRSHGLEAVAALAEVAKGSTSPHQAQRVSAARSIIELTLEAHRDEDLAVRLSKLEAERNSNGEESY